MVALKREVEITLETALMLAEPKTPMAVLAERIYDSEAELMEKLKRPWMIDRLIWMLKRKRQKVVPTNQLSLPGFEKLPSRLVMGNGRWVALRRANLTQLQQFRAGLMKRQAQNIEDLSKRPDPKIEQLDQLIALVRSYSRRMPGIIVREVMDNEQVRLQARR